MVTYLIRKIEKIFPDFYGGECLMDFNGGEMFNRFECWGNILHVLIEGKHLMDSYSGDMLNGF